VKSDKRKKKKKNGANNFEKLLKKNHFGLKYKRKIKKKK